MPRSKRESSPVTDFNGRPILVTGASGGIGGATVRHLVAAGADVIASGRSEEGLRAVAADTGARMLPFDLISEDSVAAALDGLDVWGVVNCGGFGGEIATPMETDISVFDKVMSVNARGALLVTKYASRSMIRQPPIPRAKTGVVIERCSHRRSATRHRRSSRLCH